MARFYYLGPWQSDAAEATRLGASRVRVPPPPAVAAIDLSPPNTAGRDVGVFLSPRPVVDSNYFLLGQGALSGIRLNAKIKSAFASLVGVTVDGSSLAHALVRLLTDQSDPDGASGPVGLVPENGREVKLHFGSRTPEFVQSVARSGLYWSKLVKRYQKHFQSLHDRFGPTIARKYLGDLLRQYGIPASQYKMFVPPQLRNDVPGPLAPETTYTDDFNRAGLGSNWVVFQGALIISYNRVQPDTSSKNTGYQAARWVNQLSSDNHYVEIELYTGTGSSYGGPLARHDGGSAVHGYYAETLTGGGQKLFRWNAGSATLLHSGSQTFVSGTMRKVECNGSTITHYYGTTTIGSVSDGSPITGTKYPGFLLYYDALNQYYLQGDNWTGSDLSSGSSASVSQAVGMGASVSGDASASASQGAGMGASVSGDASASASQGVGLGASASVGASASASQGTGMGASVSGDASASASQGVGMGASATASVGGSSSASASQAVGLGASASAKITVPASAAAGFGASVSGQIDGFRFPEQVIGLGATASVVLDVAGVASQAVGLGANAVAGVTGTVSQGAGFGATATAFVSHPATATVKLDASATAVVQAPATASAGVGLGAYAEPRVFCGDGRLGIGIVQPQSGTDYPLIRPSEDIRYLLADAHFYFDDPGDYLGSRFVPPLHLSWLYGLGALPATKPGWAPDPVHAVDLVVRDDVGNVVLDTTTATAFFSREWTPRLQLYAWEGADYLCWIVVHKCWSETEDPKISPRSYPVHLAAQQAILDPRTFFRRGKTVRKLSAGGVDITSGHVTIQAGYNISLSQEDPDGSPIRPSNRIEIQAVPGAGLGRYNDCDNAVQEVHRLGMATADQYGYLRLAADGCLTVMPTGSVNGSPIENGLSLWNICGPRCAPEEFVSLANYMHDISLLYDQLGDIAEQTRDQLNSEVQRWNDAVCCQQQYPIRVVAQPQLCPYMDVWGQLVNMTDQCMKNVKLKFNVQITNDTSGNADAQVIQGFTKTKKKQAGALRNTGKMGADRLQGAWPDYWMTWDEIPPQQDVWVRFRLQFSDCGLNGKKKPFQVKITATADVDGQPLQAQNCQTGSPENALASKTADLKCPVSPKDTFTPKRC